MKNYLFAMDAFKRTFWASKDASLGSYFWNEFYYYVPLSFVADGICFNLKFFAVKIKHTTIVLLDQAHDRRIHFSDYDIRYIIHLLKSSNPDFHNFLSLNLENIINKRDLCDITFKLNEKEFFINGIPFSLDFNDILCKNPADIELNGNDLIGLINLIIEKERIDDDINKVNNTCKYYLGV